MARLLYRLARFSAERRMVVAGFWIAVLLVAGSLAMSGMEIASGDISIPGTESSEALDAMDQLFPSDSSEESQALQLVFHAESGSLNDPEARQAIETTVDSARSIPHVLGVSNPFEAGPAGVSADGSVAVATIELQDLDNDQTRIDEVMTGLESAVEPARAANLTVEVGGSLEEPEAGLSVTEIAGAAIAFLVLFITYGSLAAAGANMVTALFGLVIGLTGVFATSAISPIEDSTLVLAMMLGLAVGIDYSLFILSRFRDELRAGKPVSEAVPVAIGTAGSAVVFAGLTVVIALTGLTVVNIPPITEMGLAAAGMVAVAVLVSLTVMPALLRTLGYRALSRRDRKQIPLGINSHAGTPSGKSGFLQRWARVVTSYPKQSLVIAVGLLAIVAVPFFFMETALSVPGGANPESTERRAYNLVTDAFGEGSQSPLIVLVESPDAASDAATVQETISELDHVAGVSDPQPNADGTAAILSVVSTNGPNDDETSDLVRDIRSATGNIDGASVSVTGQTAVDIDINQKLSDALIQYIVLIVGLAMVLLIVLFRSILVPLVASLGFLLSLGASLGMTVAIFQWGWLGGIFNVEEGRPLQSVFPIIIVGILFGLAMDYQVFLVSKIHEAHVRGLSTRDAILDGFGRSASVVVAAATIMFSVFAGFAFSGLDIVAALAFALAAGIVVDAFLVRMVVVPASQMLLGNATWWIPSWLDRILPTIDTEGRTLEQRHHVETPHTEPAGWSALRAGSDD